jgi:hypothetical protein
MKRGFVFRINWVVIVLFVAILLQGSCHPKKYQPVSTLSAVPPSSPVFVKINDFVSFSQSIGEQNNWWKLLGNIQKMKPLNKNLSAIDSLMNETPELKDFLKEKEIVVSFFKTEKETPELLVIIPVDISGEQKKAESIISGLVKKNGLTSTKRKLNRATIHEVKSAGKGNFHYSFSHKFLIVSQNEALIEETIDHLETRKDEADQSLAPLLKTTNNQAQLNIFVNHQFAGELLSIPLSKTMKQQCEQLNHFAVWSELDVTIKDEKVILSGFSNNNSQSNYFATILLNQQSGISKIESVLPVNTAIFSGYYLSDIEKFFADLNAFQLKKGHQPKEQSATLQHLFCEFFDGEMANVSFNPNPSAPKLNSLFVVKTKSGSFTLDKMKELLNSNSIDAKKASKEFKVDNQTSITIFKSPYPNFVSLLFGDMFQHVETEWFTIYGNYLFFSDSFEALGKVIVSNILGETLLADNDYSKFRMGLSSKNNYYFYCNTTTSFAHANLFFNDVISNDISTNEEFRKFRHFSWQVSSSGNMVYNNSSIVFDQNVKFKPQTVWQSHLSATLSQQPLLIENSYNSQENEIVLFDSNNNLYLLNNVGRIVWQINTGSPILGSVGLVDLGGKGEKQLVFNTKDKLFVIDRKGNAVKNFPVNFSVAASNGVAIFDYENNKNYRFFVAGNDQTIYAFDDEGQPVEGWQPPKTDHPVSKPVQHFSVDGKDYIVVSDRMKDYIFDRKGNVRVETDFVYQHSGNNILYLEYRTKTHEPRLVCTDAEGNIHYTYFDGKHTTTSFNKLDDSHYFLAANVNEDDETEYIFTQGNQLIVQAHNTDTLFTIMLNEETIEKPFLYHFSSKVKKIGLTAPVTNKIYLFESDGSLYKGFPLDGCTSFSIDFIGGDQTRFNLLVGSPDAYLYNYLVE